jgi:hypothetical protein
MADFSIGRVIAILDAEDRLSAQVKTAEQSLGRLRTEVQRTGQEFRQATSFIERVEQAERRLVGAQQEAARAAHAEAVAVQHLGGVSKLTAQQVHDLTRMVREGETAYKALGQSAPASIKQVSAELKHLEQQQQSLNGWWEKQGQSFTQMVASFAAGFGVVELGKAVFSAITNVIQAAGRAAVEFAADSIKSYAAAEASANKVTAALRTQGNATPQVIQQYAQLAAKFQETTAFSDDLVQSAQALFIQIGNIGPEQMDKALAAATDLSAGLGIDLEKATTLVSKAMTGHAEALSRYGVTLDSARVEAEGLDYVVGELQKRFGGQAVAELDTYSGQVKKLANDWDNVKEAIGKLLVKNDLAKLALREFGDAVNQASKDAEDATPSITKFWLAVAGKTRDIPVIGDATALPFLAIAAQTKDVEDLAGAANVTADLAKQAEKLSKVPSPFAEWARESASLGDGLKEGITQFNSFSTTIAIARGELAKFKADPTSVKDLTAAINAGIFSEEQLIAKTGLSKEALKLFTEEVKGSAKAVDEFAKVFDEVSGKKAATELGRVFTAWNQLPPAIRATGAAQATLLAEYEKLGPKLTKVPEKLKAQVIELNKQLLALGKFNIPVTNLTSLDGIGKSIVDTFTKGFADVLEVEDKFIDDMARSWEAGKFLASIGQSLGNVEQEFIDSATDLDNRLALMRVEGQARQLLQLQQAKQRELDALRASLGDQEELYKEQAAKVEEIFARQAKEITGTFGSNLKKGLTAALGNIPQTIVDGLVNGASAADIAAAVASQIGAAIGSAIGTAIGGPLGGQIGAAIGSLLGPLVDSIIVTRAEQTQRKVRNEFGVAISEGLAQAIEDAAEQFDGDRQAAKLFNLDKIIAEGGGINEDNFGQLAARFHDVFSSLETGTMSLADAQTVLDKNFRTFTEYLGGNVNPALKEIIRLNDEFGTQSKAIADYVDAEAKKGLKGISEFITLRGEIATRFAEAQQKVDDLTKRGKGGSDLREAREELARYKAQLDALPIAGQGAADAIGGALLGVFDRLTKDGASPLQVLRDMQPTIDSWSQQLAQAGLNGGAAFDRIRSMALLANDTIAGPVLQSIQSLGEGLLGLNNANILTPEMFSGMAGQVTALVGSLQAQGKTMAEIYPFAADSLQTIWELQKDYGYAVDKSTQALLDQAEADGVVGESHRSVQEQMLTATNDIRDAVEALAHTFGAVLPKDMEAAAKAAEEYSTQIEKDFEGIDPSIDVKYDIPELRLPRPRDITVNVRYKPGERPEGLAGGGLVGLGHAPIYRAMGGPLPVLAGAPVYAAMGAQMWTPRGTDTVPAMLTAGEYVHQVAAVRRYGDEGMDAVNRGAATILLGGALPKGTLDVGTLVAALSNVPRHLATGGPVVPATPGEVMYQALGGAISDAGPTPIPQGTTTADTDDRRSVTVQFGDIHVTVTPEKGQDARLTGEQIADGLYARLRRGGEDLDTFRQFARQPLKFETETT